MVVTLRSVGSECEWIVFAGCHPTCKPAEPGRCLSILWDASWAKVFTPLVKRPKNFSEFVGNPRFNPVATAVTNLRTGVNHQVLCHFSKDDFNLPQSAAENHPFISTYFDDVPVENKGFAPCLPRELPLLW